VLSWVAQYKQPRIMPDFPHTSQSEPEQDAGAEEPHTAAGFPLLVGTGTWACS